MKEEMSEFVLNRKSDFAIAWENQESERLLDLEKRKKFYWHQICKSILELQNTYKKTFSSLLTSFFFITYFAPGRPATFFLAFPISHFALSAVRRL